MTTPNPKFHVLIAAAGSGTRFKHKTPKQYCKINGKTILRHTIEAFLSCPDIGSLKVIIDPKHADLYHDAVQGLDLPNFISGSNTRNKSIYNGLKDFSNLKNEDIILIHDAARPLIKPKEIGIVSRETFLSGAATLATPITETLKYANKNNKITRDINRENAWSIQTPQGFHYGLIKHAHEQVKDTDYTDDTSLVQALGHKVTLIKGSKTNIKITTQDDLKMVEALMSANKQFKTRNLETPNLETPNLETPNLETPNFETPNFETPNFETPNFETPNFETPNFETPNFETPNFETPNFETPNFETPNFETPNFETPNFETPNFETPNFETPNFETRVGQGYDVHAFAPETNENGTIRPNTIRLCGIDIPHPQKLSGHSDADVGLHAITDAILGAIAGGDIGTHFPPSDDNFKNMDSAIFLEHAIKLATESGAKIINIDLTLICEAPKIAPHNHNIISRIAEITGLHENRISVKATTSERLGFTGRKEGIAATAIATIQTPAIKD